MLKLWNVYNNNIVQNLFFSFTQISNSFSKYNDDDRKLKTRKGKALTFVPRKARIHFKNNLHVNLINVRTVYFKLHLSSCMLKR